MDIGSDPTSPAWGLALLVAPVIPGHLSATCPGSPILTAAASPVTPSEKEGGKCFPVQSDEHLLTVVRYIERNAVGTGLAAISHPYNSESADSVSLGL
jgi:hypothetical protein